MNESGKSVYEMMMDAKKKMEESVVPEPMEFLLFPHNYIKVGFKIGYFYDHEGIVYCGGIKVMDTLTQSVAITKDYVEVKDED